MKSQYIFRNASPAKPYTVIDNRLLQARGVSPDVRGFVATLLSMPLDWKFRPEWAKEEFDIGETRLERIIRDAKKAGFMRTDRERGADGRVTGRTVYLFTDVPHVFNGETVTGKTQVMDSTVTGEIQVTENPGYGKPPPIQSKERNTKEIQITNIPPNPLKGERAAEENCFTILEEVKKTPSARGRAKVRKCYDYTPAFEEVWKITPDRQGMSKPAALKSWNEQGCEEIASEVLHGMQRYSAWLTNERRRRRDYPVKHLQGWITDRRWENFQEEPAPMETNSVIEADASTAEPPFELPDDIANDARAMCPNRQDYLEAALRIASREHRWNSSMTTEWIREKCRHLASIVADGTPARHAVTLVFA